MFEYIKGKVELINEDYIVVENNGIGFKLTASQNTISKLRLHEETTIFTHLNVREDDMSLYGFSSRDELFAFRLLIAVSGIGPKGAIAILSTLTMDELRLAVISEDHKAIAKANGIGPKTAQRVVIELKDKFKLDDLSFIKSGEDLPIDTTSDTIQEAALALTSLGYSNVEALRAIKNVKDADEMSVEQLLKEALKKII